MADQVAAYIPIEVREKLNELAKGDDRSVSYHVRVAIQEYLEKKAFWAKREKEGRDA